MAKLAELFYNHPTKQWHFEQLRQEAHLSRAQTNEWIKRLLKEKMIQRIKPKGRMPYYLAQYQHPHYQNSKRLYAFQQLHESGLLDYLASLEKAQAVILFGSFSRWDWYDKSDIDIFVYGDVGKVYVGQFMPALQREIQIFTGRNEHDLQRMGSALLRNIIKGLTIKGTIPKEVFTHAAI